MGTIRQRLSSIKASGRQCQSRPLEGPGLSLAALRPRYHAMVSSMLQVLFESAVTEASTVISTLTLAS